MGSVTVPEFIAFSIKKTSLHVIINNRKQQEVNRLTFVITNYEGQNG
jgi:hypothetical protein